MSRLSRKYNCTLVLTFPPYQYHDFVTSILQEDEVNMKVKAQDIGLNYTAYMPTHHIMEAYRQACRLSSIHSRPVPYMDME
jgi:hypothetical protein